MASSFVYTLIPADEDEPMQELRMDVPTTLEENIGCLTKTLQDHYRRVAPFGGEESKQALADAVKAQLKQQNPDAKAPDEAMLSMLAVSQTVDIVQLLPATAASGFMGVNMYVDDKGQSKGSAVNNRASAVCTQCGLPTEVRGDAFLAKVWDDQDGFIRHDLTIADVSSDADWVAEARQRNANRTDPNAAAAQLKALDTSCKAKPKVPDAPLAERLASAAAAKAAGTELFKQGDLEGAAGRYEEALTLFGAEAGLETDAACDLADVKAASELLVVCLVNLAACRLKQERPYDAIAACDRAVALDDQAGKAWYRRGQACMALGQYGAARKNLTRAATLLPSSREVREEHARCQEALKEKRAAGFEL